MPCILTISTVVPRSTRKLVQRLPKPSETPQPVWRLCRSLLDLVHSHQLPRATARTPIQPSPQGMPL